MLHLLDRHRDEMIRDTWERWLKTPELTPEEDWDRVIRRNVDDSIRAQRMKLFRIRGWLGQHGQAGGILARAAKAMAERHEESIEALTRLS